MSRGQPVFICPHLLTRAFHPSTTFRDSPSLAGSPSFAPPNELLWGNATGEMAVEAIGGSTWRWQP